MTYQIITYFTDEAGKAYHVGDRVTVTWHNGGGAGGCQITKITKTGFRYTQGGGREKSVQLADVKNLTLY